MLNLKSAGIKECAHRGFSDLLYLSVRHVVVVCLFELLVRWQAELLLKQLSGKAKTQCSLQLKCQINTLISKVLCLS